MDSFVTRQNIERYRRLADETTDAAERLRVINSMAEEWANFERELKGRAALARHGVAFVRPSEARREEQRGAD